MKTVSGGLLVLLAILSYGGVIFGWGYGVHHAFSRHSWFAGCGSIFFPPAGFYLTIESFLHKE